jgi:two-component system chemotaxis sensor kinase CheA
MVAVKDAYRYFRVEARELLEQMSVGVLDLEKQAGAAQIVVPRLLRLAHTLKGAARVVKQPDIANWAHAIEDTLLPWRETTEAVPRECIDRVLACLDQIGAQVATLTPPADAASAGPLQSVPEEAVRTLRTDVAEMDALLDGVAQTHAEIAALRRSGERIAGAGALAQRLLDQLAVRRDPDNPRAGVVTHNVRALAEELRTLVCGLEQGLVSSIDQVDRELRQLRDAAEQLRLMPAGALFAVLERSARDAAQTLGKRVLFEGRGGEVRLDAQVMGAVQGALLQAVRNAVAHGIEPPGVRQAAGKPPEGRVTLAVTRRGQHVVFSCGDDGAGIDVDAVRRSAQRKGLLGAATNTLDVDALLQLLMRGGLSTAGTVTEVAGRGIGLDVVRETAERLGGEVSVRTALGQGTTLELRVPLSLAGLDALVVEAAGTVVAIPLDAVRRTLRLAPQDIARSAQGDTIIFQGRAIPCIALAQLLDNASPPRTRRHWSVVIVESAGALAAVGVDRLLAPAQLVLRSLPELTPASPLVAGASLDVEGNPQLVLDAEALVLAAQRAGAPAPPAETARVPVLVVDDSLTTRMLEQSILESAGYAVHAAVSGEDALEQARRHAYALFLVDVEMPGMDGFAFIERTRADPALRDVPAMLVTSRSSAQDRQRGRDVGAQAYVVKSEFAQNAFLEQVRQLVHTSRADGHGPKQGPALAEGRSPHLASGVSS